MVHQVSPVEELHHEEQVILGLEGTEEVGEKGILPSERQHPLLHHGALHIIVDQNYILLEGLDSEEFLFAFQLCKQHLPEAAFAQDLVEDEVLNVAPGAALPDLAIGPVVCWTNNTLD